MNSLPAWLETALFFTDGSLLTPAVQAELASSPEVAPALLTRADASIDTLHVAASSVGVLTGEWALHGFHPGRYRTAEQEANLLEVLTRLDTTRRNAIRHTCYAPISAGRRDAIDVLIGRKLTKTQRRILLGLLVAEDFIQCPELTEWFLELNPHEWVGEYVAWQTPAGHVSDARILRTLTVDLPKPGKQVVAISQDVEGYSQLLHTHGHNLAHILEPRPAVAEQLAQYPAWLPVIAATSHWKDAYAGALEVWKEPTKAMQRASFSWHGILSTFVTNPVADDDLVQDMIDNCPGIDGAPPHPQLLQNLRNRRYASKMNIRESTFRHHAIMSRLAGERSHLESYLHRSPYSTSMIGSVAGLAAEEQFPGILSGCLRDSQIPAVDRRAELQTDRGRPYKAGTELVHSVLEPLPESRRGEAVKLLINLVGDTPSAEDERSVRAVDTVLALLGA